MAGKFTAADSQLIFPLVGLRGLRDHQQRFHRDHQRHPLRDQKDTGAVLPCHEIPEVARHRPEVMRNQNSPVTRGHRQNVGIRHGIDRSILRGEKIDPRRPSLDAAHNRAVQIGVRQKAGLHGRRVRCSRALNKRARKPFETCVCERRAFSKSSCLVLRYESISAW